MGVAVACSSLFVWVSSEYLDFLLLSNNKWLLRIDEWIGGISCPCAITYWGGRRYTG